VGRLESDIGLDFPWHKFGRMGNLTGIMLGEAGTEIGGAADVALIWMGETAENVGIVHRGIPFFIQPSFAKATEGTILRPSFSGCLADGLPSVARRAKDGGGCGSKTTARENRDRCSLFSQSSV
jgi:hypothetical protein